MQIKLVTLSLVMSFLACSSASAACNSPAVGENAEARATATPAERLRVERLRDCALKSEEVWENLNRLVKTVGARPAGSPKEAKAALWSYELLRKMGFDRVTVQAFAVPRWIRGQASARISEPSPMDLNILALGGTPGTPKEGIATELVIFKSWKEFLKSSPKKIRGKIPFVAEEMIRHESGKGYRLLEDMRTKGAAIASSRGAVAYLYRSLGTEMSFAPHTGQTKWENGTQPIPAAAVSTLDSEKIMSLVKRKGPILITLHSSASYAAPAFSYNVIADIRGTKYPEKIILLRAHLDSWDVGQGAIDGGAGMMVLASAAQQIIRSGHRPKRTIRVVFFGAEEIGLLGTKAYVNSLSEAGLRNHILAGESDLGAGKVRYVGFRGDFGRSKRPGLERLLKPLGIPLSLQNKAGGSHVIKFAKSDVDIVGLFQDASAYFDYHHSKNDVIDNISKDALRHNVAAWTVVSWWAANVD